MTTALARYDALCRALAEAATVDEVKYLNDEAVAIAAYARMSKNRELEAQCVEIRMRATRRLGEMVRTQKLTIGLAKGGRPKTGVSDTPVSVPTFGSQGIDKNLAKDARTLGDLPPEKFEERVAEAREAALGVVERVVRRQARETAKHDRAQPYGKPTDHPAAPFELRQKAREQRSKAAKLSRMAPNTLDGWRRGYLNAVRMAAPDLDAEMQIIVDGIHEIAGDRMKKRAAG